MVNSSSNGRSLQFRERRIRELRETKRKGNMGIKEEEDREGEVRHNTEGERKKVSDINILGLVIHL